MTEETPIKRKGSNRHKLYGMSAELNRKLNSKYPKELEVQCREWIEMMAGENVRWGVEHEHSRPGDAFAEALDNGVILCKIINEVVPKSVPKVHQGEKVNSFQGQENINNFLEACYKPPFNCVPAEMFPTVYLYERQNVAQVLNGIQAFARRANAYDKTVPLFGPKQYMKNPRHHEPWIRSYRGDQ
ncbi:calponin-1 isoform X2 [Exaiptasia diaphana]|uniref:Calponin-homology (CH) domain-containing protein n=1 Tax=Exaiptasia diaphana TaxID=2652724 RepID=A0A913Y7N7_EXADI|nr:calponin-1 isoform X2 [Exaiptasia diaphana]